MVMAGRSVHLTTLFPGQAWTSSSPVLRTHTFACNWQQPFLNDSAEGRRMTVEIISWSISTKVWDRAGIELATPGSAVRLASVARHVTDCATRPGILEMISAFVCLMPRSHIHGSPCRFHYGSNPTDDPGNARIQYGNIRTNTDCHWWCRIVSLANPASNPWMCDLGIKKKNRG